MVPGSYVKHKKDYPGGHNCFNLDDIYQIKDIYTHFGDTYVELEPNPKIEPVDTKGWFIDRFYEVPAPDNNTNENNIRDTQVGGNHYSKLAIQPYDYATANKLGYIEGNVIKYVTRWKDKNGVEDLKKAVHSLQWLIEHTESKNSG